MKDIIIAAIFLVLFIGGLVLFVTKFEENETARLNETCLTKFGAEFEGRNAIGYGPEICVNEAGEVKYP